MDLLIAFFVLIAIIIGGSVLLALLNGERDVLDFNPQKRLEKRYAAEFEDMENLLHAHNARRAREGLPPQTEEEYDAERRRQERGWKL